MEIQEEALFFEHFAQVHDQTEQIVACIPANRLEWTIQEGRFSLGDIVRHLGAIERYTYAENALGKPSRYPGHGRGLAAGYKKVMAFYAEMHRQSLEIFASLSLDDLEKKFETPSGVTVTVWKWLHAMVEHEIHHQGQLSVYLEVLGVSTPQIFEIAPEPVEAKLVGYKPAKRPTGPGAVEFDQTSCAVAATW